jgi:hypothetical protein
MYAKYAISVGGTYYREYIKELNKVTKKGDDPPPLYDLIFLRPEN